MTVTGWPPALNTADPDQAADDLAEGLKAMDKADRAYGKAQTYYEGSFPEVFASPRLRAALARTGVDFRLNFAKTPVDAVVSRLRINAITSPVAGVQERIAQIWKDNQLDLFEILSFRRACEFGDSYLLVWPDETLPCGVRVYLNNPRIMRIIYDAENEIEKRFAIKRWTDGAVKKAYLYYPDRIEKYATTPGKNGSLRDDWQPFYDPADEGQWPLENPFGQVPVFHLRTDFQYGQPEHLNAYGPQNLVHKLAMGHAAGIDYHALPQRYALLEDGTTSNDFAVGDEDEFSYPLDTGATTSADDGRAQLRSEAGSIWLLSGIKGLGEFAPSDPQVFIAPMEFYVRAMAQICTTPAHYFDTIGQTPSGESLRTMEAPFVEKVENRQLLFGGAWRDAIDFAIYVAMGVEDPQISVHWNPCSSVSDMQTWQTAEAKNRLGVPAKQLLLEAGYNEEQVEAWLAEGAQSLEQQIETLNAIGVAAQGLAIAIQLGAVDESDVKALLARMLGFEPAGPGTLGSGARAAIEPPEADDPGSIADESDVEVAGDGGEQ
jgi:hypothetical protein